MSSKQALILGDHHPYVVQARLNLADREEHGSLVGAADEAQKDFWDRDGAAALIQSRYRGNKQRHRKQAEAAEMDDAAARIQSIFRGEAEAGPSITEDARVRRDSSIFDLEVGDEVEYYSNTLRAWQDAVVTSVSDDEVSIRYGERGRVIDLNSAGVENILRRATRGTESEYSDYSETGESEAGEAVVLCPICQEESDEAGAQLVFVDASCPVCGQTTSPVVALECGHVICKEDFAKLKHGQRDGAGRVPALPTNEQDGPASAQKELGELAAGDAVEYYSNTLGTWQPAQVEARAGSELRIEYGDRARVIDLDDEALAADSVLRIPAGQSNRAAVVFAPDVAVEVFSATFDGWVPGVVVSCDASKVEVQYGDRSRIFDLGGGQWMKTLRVRAAAPAEELPFIEKQELQGRKEAYVDLQADYEALKEGLSLEMQGESWPTAAIHMENPYCSCRLTRVRLRASRFHGGAGGAERHQRSHQPRRHGLRGEAVSQAVRDADDRRRGSGRSRRSREDGDVGPAERDAGVRVAVGESSVILLTLPRHVY